MIHETEVKKYNGTLEELAEDIGNLRYDALAEFLKKLDIKLSRDANSDLKKIGLNYQIV